MVTTTLLEEFKERMHISHSSEDSNLKRLLSFSVAYIEDKCGKFNLEGNSNIDKRAKELVFERTRYLYNDAVEYFDTNFQSDIISLQFEILFAKEKEGEQDEEV